MKCPKCGKEIADDSQFCESCGARVAINGDEPKKKTNWWGILGGAGLMIVGITIWSHSIGNSKQQVDVTQSGSVYYGTYIGEQYIYDGLCDAIQKNYNWNSTEYKPEQGNYEVTNVRYQGEILIQIVPGLDSKGEPSALSVSVQIPTSKMKKFKSINTFSYFSKDPGWENYFYAGCQNDINLAARIISDVLQNVFDVPHGAKLDYTEK